MIKPSSYNFWATLIVFFEDQLKDLAAACDIVDVVNGGYGLLFTSRLTTSNTLSKIPQVIKLVDLNNDGKLDILTANRHTSYTSNYWYPVFPYYTYDNKFGSITRLFNNGAGTFTQYNDTVFNYYSQQIVNTFNNLDVGDFNNDSNIDIAIASPYQSFVFYRDQNLSYTPGTAMGNLVPWVAPLTDCVIIPKL